MVIGFYDGDILQVGNKFIPNLELMKIYGYYNRKNHILRFVQPKDNLEGYDKIYYRQDNKGKISPIIASPNVDYGGYAFTQTKYHPMSMDIERVEPYLYMYEPYSQQISKQSYWWNGENYAFQRLTLDGTTINPYLNFEKRHLVFYDRDIQQLTDVAYYLNDIGKQICFVKGLYANNFDTLLQLKQIKHINRSTQVFLDCELEQYEIRYLAQNFQELPFSLTIILPPSDHSGSSIQSICQYLDQFAPLVAKMRALPHSRVNFIYNSKYENRPSAIYLKHFCRTMSNHSHLFGKYRLEVEIQLRKLLAYMPELRKYIL